MEGHLFESKLLTLFLLRGTDAGYPFQLASNDENMGGKFDDLIFRYEVDTPTAGKHWRYRYLQAKHSTQPDKEKITTSKLFEASKGDNFSLPKYFLSYRKMINRKEDVHDCIICTNIGFDTNDFDQKDIDYETLSCKENILEFGRDYKTTRYKLKKTDKLTKKLTECLSATLAEELRNCVTNNKALDLRGVVLDSYHVALVEDHVLDLKINKFHQDFLDNLESLSVGAKQLRQSLGSDWKADWKAWNFQFCDGFGKRKSGEEFYFLPSSTENTALIEDFFNKLVFVVNMPNENDYDRIIESVDVSKYYSANSRSTETKRILDEMLKWFKTNNAKKNRETKWLSLQDGRKLLLSSVANKSITYQNHLKEKFGFNKLAIDRMAKKLKTVLASEDKIKRITTQLPIYTSVKVIEAIRTIPDWSSDDSLLVVGSDCLENQKEQWANIMKLMKKESNQLLIVVCDNFGLVNFDNNYYAMLTAGNCKIIIISNEPDVPGLKDDIDFKDLSDELKKTLLGKIVSFQGTDATVRDIIECGKPEEVVDVDATMELMKINEEKIYIPSFDSARFEKSLYIKRQLTFQFPFDDQFWQAVGQELDIGDKKFNFSQKECEINSKGKIEWNVDENKRKQQIWKTIQPNLEKRNSMENLQSHTTHEDELIHREEWERRAVIISGIAGTGKSTILSHYYDEIKKVEPNSWVIKINLTEHSEALSKFNSTAVENEKTSAIEFIIEYLPGLVKNPFIAKSLLRYRLETGKGVVLMFDGFDEIDGLCQEKTIQLMKIITRMKLARLYVTVRSHMLDNLQFQLSQLAYSLKNFERQDQIDCVSSFWKMNLIETPKEDLNHFSEVLVDRVSQTLKDNERGLIGVPLQCRILAECFQSSAQEQNKSISGDQSFDLDSLYKQFIEIKRQVFRHEKITAYQITDHITNSSIEITMNYIEIHLRKLAIQTIIANEEHVEMLCPVFIHRSNFERQQNLDKLNELGVRFGLLDEIGFKGKTMQFIHRTFAEYLVAEYIYNGFLLEDDCHNKLLEKEEVRKLIIQEILVQPPYEGVRLFLDSMFKKLVERMRNRIDQETKLPYQLQQFFHNLLLYVENHSVRLGRLCSLPTINSPALSAALQKGNFNTLTFFCDCLDAVFDKSKIQLVIIYLLRCNRFWIMSINLFKRFINYFDATDEDQVIMALIKSCIVHQHWDYYDMRWKQEECQNIVKMFIQYMEDNLQALIKTVQKNLEEDESNSFYYVFAKFVHFFTFTEYFDSLFKQFLMILSQVYSDSMLTFAKLIKEAFTPRFILPVYNERYYWIEGQMEKTLTLLRDLGQTAALIGLSRIVLLNEHLAFERFYLHNQDRSAKDDGNFERDSYGMTRLHRAAFYGDEVEVNKLIDTTKKNLLSANSNKVISGQMVVDYVARSENDDYVTPLYIAAFRGEEQICHDMLTFLKQVLSADQLKKDLTSENGFLHGALLDSIKLRKINTFRLILKSVKEILGRDALTDLLKSNVPSNLFNSMLCYCSYYNDKMLFEILLNIIAEDIDNEDYYENLNNLFLHNFEFCRSLINVEVETFQGMLSAKGTKDWTKRLFGTVDLHVGFDLVSNYLICKFKQNHLSDFVDVISSTVDGRSYWADFIRKYYTGHNVFSKNFFTLIDNLLKGVSSNLGEIAVKKLVLHEVDESIAIVIAAWRGGEKQVNSMLSYLSPESQSEVRRIFAESAVSLIWDTFFSSVSENKDPIWKKLRKMDLVNVLLFYLNHGSKDQLSKFVKEITRARNYGKEKRNVLSQTFYYEGNAILCNFNEEKINNLNEFCGCLLVKLGEVALKDVVLHDDGNQYYNLVLASRWLLDRKRIPPPIYTSLSKETRDDILHGLFTNRSALINLLGSMDDKNLTEWTKHLLGIDSWGMATNLMDGFYVLSVYWINQMKEVQVQNLIKFIVSVKCSASARSSIWSDFIDKACACADSVKFSKNLYALRKFLDVSKKVGVNINDLMLHNVGNGEVLSRVLTSGNVQIYGMMLTRLNQRDQQLVSVDKLFTTSGIIEKMLKNKGSQFWIRYYLGMKEPSNADDGFQVFLNYFKEAMQDYISTQENEAHGKLTMSKIHILGINLMLNKESGFWTRYYLGIDQSNVLHVDTSFEEFMNCFMKVILTHLNQQEQLLAKDVLPDLFKRIGEMLKNKTSEFWGKYYEKSDADARTGFEVLVNYFIAKFNKEQLEEFVNLIMHVNKIEGKTIRSVWNDLFIPKTIVKDDSSEKSIDIQIIRKFLKYVKYVLGERVVKQLLLHDDGHGLVITDVALFEGMDVLNAVLDNLSTNKREKVEIILIRNTLLFIEKTFLPRSNIYCTSNFNQHPWLNIFYFYVNYANCEQLDTFVENIKRTFIDDEGREWSIFGKFMNEFDYDEFSNLAKGMKHFMTCLSEKLGNKSVKELLLHKYGDKVFILDIVTWNSDDENSDEDSDYEDLNFRVEDDLVEVFLSHLNEEDREEIQILIKSNLHQ